MSERSRGFAQQTLSTPSARSAAGLLAVLMLVAVFARWLAPFDPFAQPDLAAGAMAPSWTHAFGTDRYSRDVLSRMMFGTQVSLSVAAASVIIASLLGTAVGALAGFLGGAVDRWIMRGVDAVLSIPRLLVLLFVAAAFPRLSVLGFALVLGLTGWPAMTRIVRAQVREVSSLEYVLAARVLGARPLRVLMRHVLPAVAPQILVVATLSVATVIPLEAGLSFLGLGVQSPTPSWGNIMLEGAERGANAWWLLVFPAFAIVLTVLSVNVLGERLRGVVDPRSGESA